MIRSHRSDERGIALALAIFALVVIGALVAANFFVGRLEQQSGQNSLYARQAAEGAESGLLEAVALLPASTLVALPQAEFLWTWAAARSARVCRSSVR